ncbi:transposase, partial [[Clostridium] innocuum]
HRIPQGILKAVTISKQQDRYIATCLFEYENKVESKEVVHVLGLDYSQKHLYVDSEGQVCDYPHFYCASEKRLAREQRKLSKMVKGSNNYKKQRNKVAKLHAHVAQNERIYQCPKCGHIEDRDINAAKNIRDEGIRLHRG